MNPDVFGAIHLAATGMMTGLIWFVQLIHYPWFHEVPEDRFVDYHKKYTRAVGWIVGPVMMAELITGGLLLFMTTGLARTALGVSLAILGVIWWSTLCLQIPGHHRLSTGYDSRVHKRLVHSNWIRTAGWSLRLLLLIGMYIYG